ncbi:N-acetylneuraminate synthase family protein [Desulfolutivibrio sulfoxidireducens]|uniref:N-acetylneuraminate synthase family protein n=1 Tax=Desulfolutivibrio sulfoxidireducens TaxID=2773299 RepID=UPI00159EB5E1|nr:N-acetylneuraminate synthase family protein [Desulfolutivibrio sulfoxidireducens]QLA14813.1 N-acylneuraminate-9-phosphate synthase [Desulfolutivibrio sulfoxidireducens]QLA18385.1 N-acylneuraminate-9-phosphate synthase [Desulfolutivibrio sulfoxidireducens]
MNATNVIRIASGRRIGPGEPCFLVAEIGNNHHGDPAMARDMVHAAAEAGADAVKFQKRDMDSLLTRAGRESPYRGAHSFGPTYGAHRQALELDLEAMAGLKTLAEKLGLVFFASAWDQVSAREMLGLGMELFKVGSADLVNVPLLRLVGESGVPAILSTGMSLWPDVDLAVAEMRRFHDRVVLLHCNSSYPCPEELVGLPVMTALARRYGLAVGYSGHEPGLGPSVAAVALGACVVERHFTLDRSQRGTDHQASLEPGQFAQLRTMIRETEAAMRLRDKRICEAERASAAKLRKSIVFTRDLPAGHVLGPADITVKCPGGGISPARWDEVSGARLTRGVLGEELVDWDCLVCDRSSAALAGRS